MEFNHPKDSPMRLAWTINRLRSMGPVEIVHRVAEHGRKIVSRHLHQGWPRFADTARIVTGLPGLREAVLAATPEDRAAIAAAAARVLTGRFEALGQAWPERRPNAPFSDTVWRLDPVTGELWPGAETYCFDINFRDAEARGDVKYVWEFNRLQFLEPLAAHALLTGDADSIVAIEAAIASWHAANPPFGSVGWASGIEVALRAISLLFALSLTGDRLSSIIRQRAGEVLAASAFWLVRFPSKFSSANNHLVAELAGEFLIATVLGTATGSSRQALLDEIDKQILPDGAGAEQTPTYAAFTAELALLCATTARGAGAPFSAAFDTRIAAFADYVHWLSGSGLTPAFGDNDEGRVLSLIESEADYPRSVAAAIFGYLGRPGPPVPPDFRGLLLGRPREIAGLPTGLKSFIDGGTSICHGEIAGHSVGLTFDHGPLGYLAIAAHGHADALSLTLSVDGKPVLVDPGTYLYGSGGVWRRWFRGTPAHNTLNLGGESQSVISGPFNWSHKASAQLDARVDGESWRLDASHDGYVTRFGVRHHRTITRQGNAIAIADHLSGGAPKAAEIVFQLAPGLTTTVNGATVTIRSENRTLLRIEFPSSDFAIASGATPEAGGWVSERFGSKTPAPRIAWHGRVGESAGPHRSSPRSLRPA